MKHILHLILALLGFLFFAYAKKRSASTSSTTTEKDGEAGARRVRAVAKKTPVAALTDRNFTTYAVERPRDYYAFVMFTATNPHYQCSICGRSKQKFVEIANFYHDQYNFANEEPSKRIAFFTVEVDDARELFQDMKMDTIPHVYMLPPTTPDSPKMKISQFEIPTAALLEGTALALEEIETVTNIKIQPLVNPFPVLVLLGVVAALVALLVSAAKRDLFSVLLSYQSPRIWVAVSAICFAVGVSGSIFCVIRSAQPFGMTRNGMMLFSMGGRDQFLIEGIIVSLWTLGCGVAAYAVYLLPSKLRRFPLLQHAAVILSMSVWVVLALHIWAAYRQKTMWYTLKETLPANVWDWMAASVKKSTSLPKRLYRVSEIWLTTEGFDWKTFQKKFKVLIVDYLLRVFATAGAGSQ